MARKNTQRQSSGCRGSFRDIREGLRKSKPSTATVLDFPSSGRWWNAKEGEGGGGVKRTPGGARLPGTYDVTVRQPRVPT